ncbi:hypothetical protein DN36_366 [Vibrio cholerae]|nr:hypothetical protein DN36_366 [Vibrio cholerae]
MPFNVIKRCLTVFYKQSFKNLVELDKQDA